MYSDEVHYGKTTISNFFVENTRVMHNNNKIILLYTISPGRNVLGTFVLASLPLFVTLYASDEAVFFDDLYTDQNFVTHSDVCLNLAAESLRGNSLKGYL